MTPVIWLNGKLGGWHGSTTRSQTCNS